MTRTLIEKNKKEAFEHFVKVRKKQDTNTIKIDGHIYSYVTKRGKLKRYIGFISYAAYKNSEFYLHKVEQVNGFWFVELKNMSKWVHIFDNHLDESETAIVGYESEEDDAAPITIAVVIHSTKEVEYKDESAKKDLYAQQVIKRVLAGL